LVVGNSGRNRERNGLDKYNLGKNDKNLERIRSVLKLMDKRFGEKAFAISSRAVAVSAYLFVESLFLENRSGSDVPAIPSNAFSFFTFVVIGSSLVFRPLKLPHREKAAG